MAASACASASSLQLCTCSARRRQLSSVIARLCTPSAPMRSRYTSMSGFHAA